MIMYDGKKYVCNIDLGMELIRGKWKLEMIENWSIKHFPNKELK